MGVVVDTSELIRIERTRIADGPRLAGLLPVEPYISAITFGELVVGARMADTVDRQAMRELFIAQLLECAPVLPFGAREAREWARLYAHLRRTGMMIGERDLQIAATAIAGEHLVLTQNVAEFERVPGLDLLRIPGL